MKRIAPWVSARKVVTISDELRAAVLSAVLNDDESPNLQFGPSFLGDHYLWAHEGPVDTHTDGAGITYGLVVVADGAHCLYQDGKSFALKAGHVFRIDSDEQHSTSCGEHDLLVFRALDHHGARPQISASAWGKRTHADLLAEL